MPPAAEIIKIRPVNDFRPVSTIVTSKIPLYFKALNRNERNICTTPVKKHHSLTHNCHNRPNHTSSAKHRVQIALASHSDNTIASTLLPRT